MSKLIIVPTPLGNLGDITFRALEVLRTADVILAEDTRKTAILLHHFGIKTKMLSHHKFNEHQFAEVICNRILQGETMALVSDAGTPSVSDPGYLLVRTCIRSAVEVECLPGPTALIPALVVSGLPSDRFVFEGFLPVKKGRQKRLSELANESRTIIFYESPHRIAKTLEQLSQHFGSERLASVSREISKIHEETLRGSLNELLSHFAKINSKGEFVIVVAGHDQ
ncbi:MAG: 16S rRNA (cytidine(1402)-2'-O)-methyltransferase [Bacteroidales bacterium]|nr:16S rRNA (cytidine(1402)-2'-O)-methyltransferase [Bacteroidales bacterium]HOY39485.1 16S rRNA (cytidine(1402)-2'-O)-methyltransferase [Bacteroidales bacterium]HQP03684.1 16S rRNA (cytidine(1402)-2'-O)-methyltransferase [Bacteroidales bacterium]